MVESVWRTGSSIFDWLLSFSFYIKCLAWETAISKSRWVMSSISLRSAFSLTSADYSFLTKIVAFCFYAIDLENSSATSWYSRVKFKSSSWWGSTLFVSASTSTELLTFNLETLGCESSVILLRNFVGEKFCEVLRVCLDPLTLAVSSSRTFWFSVTYFFSWASFFTILAFAFLAN